MARLRRAPPMSTPVLAAPADGSASPFEQAMAKLQNVESATLAMAEFCAAYDLYVDQTGLMPLGRIQQHLPSQVQELFGMAFLEAMDKDTKSPVLRLTQPVHGRNKRNEGSCWNISLLDLVGFCGGIGPGMLSRYVAQALSKAQKEGWRAGELLPMLRHVANERSGAVSENRRKNRNNSREGPPRRLCPQDVVEAVQRLRSKGDPVGNIAVEQLLLGAAQEQHPDEKGMGAEGNDQEGQRKRQREPSPRHNQQEQGLLKQNEDVRSEGKQDPQLTPNRAIQGPPADQDVLDPGRGRTPDVETSEGSRKPSTQRRSQQNLAYATGSPRISTHASDLANGRSVNSVATKFPLLGRNDDHIQHESIALGDRSDESISSDDDIHDAAFSQEYGTDVPGAVKPRKDSIPHGSELRRSRKLRRKVLFKSPTLTMAPAVKEKAIMAAVPSDLEDESLFGDTVVKLDQTTSSQQISSSPSQPRLDDWSRRQLRSSLNHKSSPVVRQKRRLDWIQHNEEHVDDEEKSQVEPPPSQRKRRRMHGIERDDGNDVSTPKGGSSSSDLQKTDTTHTASNQPNTITSHFRPVHGVKLDVGEDHVADCQETGPERAVESPGGVAKGYHQEPPRTIDISSQSMPSRGAHGEQPSPAPCSLWQRKLDALSESSASSLAQPEAQVLADVLDFVLDVLALPPFHVVNSSSSLPTSHNSYRAIREVDEQMVIPMCSDQHWVVAFVDTTTHEAVILDSLRSYSYSLQDVWERRLRAFYQRLPNRAQTVLHVVEDSAAPQQTNDFSCGIYTIVNALYRMTGVPFQEIDESAARYMLGAIVAARDKQKPRPSLSMPTGWKCPHAEQLPAPPKGRATLDALYRYGHSLQAVSSSREKTLREFTQRGQSMMSTCKSMELALLNLLERAASQQQIHERMMPSITALRKLNAEERVAMCQLLCCSDEGFDNFEGFESKIDCLAETMRVVRFAAKTASYTRASLAVEVQKASTELAENEACPPTVVSA